MAMTGSTRQPKVPDDPGALYRDRPPTVRRDFTETKNGFKTTEFMLTILFVAGVLLATYADGDSLARDDGWRYASFAVVAYLVSRGLAKLGVREPHRDEH